MANTVGSIPDVEEAAKAIVQNWKKQSNFVLFDEPKDSENYAIVYTHSRDSSLLEESNAAVIEKKMTPYLEAEDPDIETFESSHWAVGWLRGYMIRVYRDGEITPAFRACHEVMVQKEDYPILDETDYSQRQHDALVENVSSYWKRGDYELPEGWVDAVINWLEENKSEELENVDDEGPCPSDEAIVEAFEAIGYKRVVED